MAKWIFEDTIITKAKRKVAWDYWANIDNHAKLEPGVESIELDGPFQTGTTGRTITADYTQEWILSCVIEGEEFTITGHTPDKKGTLSFSWKFEDHENGTHMTQIITATGSLIEDSTEILMQMEANAPTGMAKLKASLDRLADKGE